VNCTSNKELEANYEFQTRSVSLHINDVVNKPIIVAKLVCILKAAIKITAFKADIKCWYKLLHGIFWSDVQKWTKFIWWKFPGILRKKNK